MSKLKIIPNEPKYRAIDYVNLNNPFEVVTHSGNKDKGKEIHINLMGIWFNRVLVLGLLIFYWVI